MANIKPDERPRQLFPGKRIRFKEIVVERTQDGLLRVNGQEHETHLAFDAPNYMGGSLCLVILQGDQVLLFSGMHFGLSMLKPQKILEQHGLA